MASLSKVVPRVQRGPGPRASAGSFVRVVCPMCPRCGAAEASRSAPRSSRSSGVPWSRRGKRPNLDAPYSHGRLGAQPATNPARRPRGPPISPIIFSILPVEEANLRLCDHLLPVDGLAVVFVPLLRIGTCSSVAAGLSLNVCATHRGTRGLRPGFPRSCARRLPPRGAGTDSVWERRSAESRSAPAAKWRQRVQRLSGP